MSRRVVASTTETQLDVALDDLCDSVERLELAKDRLPQDAGQCPVAQKTLKLACQRIDSVIRAVAELKRQYYGGVVIR